MTRLLIVCLLCTPVLAWWLYKPVRILAPGLVPGVTCVDATFCLDDTARLPEAAALYERAADYVSAVAGTIKHRPRAVFCATETCFRAFGFEHSKARAVGVSGIVISPRGWDRFYLRHELIHHLQAERLGVIAQLRAPAWFTEGMAYALSGTNAELEEPWNSYRAEFDAWYERIGSGALWTAARVL
ncbi:MAG: hypothetical protein R3F42_03245 [Pseudomonadota bacterium]